ncbi:MAG: hypothetical protein V7603_1099 [Micromonosporaceae bacterium]
MSGELYGSWKAAPPIAGRLRAGRAAPLYARVLGLRGIRPGAVLCFLFFEGMVALGALLALAELTSWWAVLALPAAVAVMVKVNDVVAMLLAAPPVAATTPPPVPVGPQRVPRLVAQGRAAVRVPARRPSGTNQRRFDRPVS